VSYLFLEGNEISSPVFSESGNYTPPLKPDAAEIVRNSPGIFNLIRATSYRGYKYISLALTPTEAITSRYFIGGI